LGPRARPCSAIPLDGRRMGGEDTRRPLTERPVVRPGRFQGARIRPNRGLPEGIGVASRAAGRGGGGMRAAGIERYGDRVRLMTVPEPRPLEPDELVLQVRADGWQPSRVIRRRNGMGSPSRMSMSERMARSSRWSRPCSSDGRFGFGLAGSMGRSKQTRPCPRSWTAAFAELRFLRRTSERRGSGRTHRGASSQYSEETGNMAAGGEPYVRHGSSSSSWR
jgi:hypothetical protein